MIFAKLHIKFVYFLFLSCHIFCYHENHNKPFGTGHRYQIRSHDGFINPVAFIKKHVLKNEPILFKEAARKWPAITRWSDYYFINLNLSNYNKTTVHVEVQKKENRSLGTFNMEFKEFIKVYNVSDIYLVDKIPPFLEADISVPWSLQCSLWDNAINQVLMWFSSGGTSSVVHTDDMENINCLISGEKSFVLVDPHSHRDKIPLNEKGAYSDIDVDKVDFNKYPGMASVDFQIADMVAGDCLYIPRLWIHQVRSFGRNIAINIWFSKTKHELESLGESDLNQICSQVVLNKTFSGTKFLGLGGSDSLFMEVMKDTFANISPDQLFTKLLMAYPELDATTISRSKDHIDSVINDIFIEFDKNKDSLIELEEITSSTNESVIRVSNYVKYLKMYIESIIVPISKGNTNSVLVDVLDSDKHTEL